MMTPEKSRSGVDVGMDADGFGRPPGSGSSNRSHTPPPAPSNQSSSAMLGGVGGGSASRLPSEVVVSAFGTLHIPVTYTPPSMRSSRCDVVVAVQGSSYSLNTVVWRLPVTAEAEASCTGVVFRYSCQARQQVSEEMNILLRGLGPSVTGESLIDGSDLMAPPGQQQPFSSAVAGGGGPVSDVSFSSSQSQYEFNYRLQLPDSHRSFLEQCLTVTPSEPRGLVLRDPRHPLRFRVTFAPPRPMPPAVAELHVARQRGGGRWRFEIQLEATEPELDGVITLESAIGQTATQPVPLFASGEVPEPFRAELSSDTPLSFDIKQLSPMLPTAPANGAPPPPPALLVAYNCREFGKTLRGRLTVYTADATFVYVLIGRMPAYVPPVPSQLAPTVDSRLGAEARAVMAAANERRGKRNMIRDNIKKVKVTMGSTATELAAMGADGTAGGSYSGEGGNGAANGSVASLVGKLDRQMTLGK